MLLNKENEMGFLQPGFGKNIRTVWIQYTAFIYRTNTVVHFWAFLVYTNRTILTVGIPCTLVIAYRV
jgi:hypothetical protein